MIAPELYARWQRQRAEAQRRRDRDPVGAELELALLTLARTSFALEHAGHQLELARGQIDRLVRLRSSRTS